MRRILIATLALGAAFAASAETPSATVARAETHAASPSPTCLTDTGSRITATRNARARAAGGSAGECVNAPGRSYSREDITRGGETDLGNSLRRLDTSIY